MRPQVCGSSQASKGGSACFPHMQRYSRGASPAGYSALHLGHAHAAAPAAGAFAGDTGPCDLHTDSTAYLLVLWWKTQATMVNLKRQ